MRSAPAWPSRLAVRDRLRVRLDEQRWRAYVRVPGSPSIFYRTGAHL